jgi:hypothetical protein
MKALHQYYKGSKMTVINEASYSNGKAAFYDADVINVKRLISELPSSDEKNNLNAELQSIMSSIHATEGNPAEYEVAERKYKDFKAKVRYMKPRFTPTAPVTPAAKPGIPAQRIMPTRKAKSSADKDKSFIDNRIAGLEKQLNMLVDSPAVVTAKSQLGALKQKYATTKDDDLLSFIQTEFGPISNEINKVVIANKGNIKTPGMAAQKGPEGVSRFASPTTPKPAPAKKEMSPEEFLAAHPELADDPSMMESLNESSSTLLTTMSIKTGLPKAQLAQFWDLAQKKNSTKSQSKDTAFWANVMKDFQSLIDNVDIEEARNVMETREKYKEAANSFLNNLADDNYTEAQTAFKSMVDNRLNDNINAKAEKYCKEVLSKEAQKLTRDL